MNFQTLEARFQDLSKKHKLTTYMVPLNMNQEKQRFLEDYKSKKRYNPIFNYAQLNLDEQLIEALTNLKQDFHDLEGFEYQGLIDLYCEQMIDHLINQLKFYSEPRDSNAFTTWLSSLYPSPSQELLAGAQQALSDIETEEVETQTLDPFMMQKIMSDALEERQFEGWSVVIKPMVARISVNSLHKTVSISERALFEPSSVGKLIVHELDTHVRRAFNGTFQPYLFLQTGFNITETEEGLATLAEYKTGYRSIQALSRSALRVILCHKSMEMGFYELFEFALPYCDSEDKAFELVTRIKRGLTDTALPGGWLKDQLYYKGFQRVQKTSPQILRKLYLGKISLEQLEWIEYAQQPLHLDFTLPAWLKESF